MYQNQSEFGPDKAFDDNPETRWGCDWGTKSAWLEVDLGEAKTFKRAWISEPYGRVQEFELQVSRTASGGHSTAAKPSVRTSARRSVLSLAGMCALTCSGPLKARRFGSSNYSPRRNHDFPRDESWPPLRTRKPDRVPRWCGASPEFLAKAKRELNLPDTESVFVRFGDDFRRVFARYTGPEFSLRPGATSRTIFGVERAGHGYGQPSESSACQCHAATNPRLPVARSELAGRLRIS